MPTLVDLPTAKLHLRVDDSAEDALITLYLEAAQASVVEFLNRNVYATQDELDAAAEVPPTEPVLVNAAIKAAILLLVGHLFANREDVVTGTIASNLPMGSRVLLQPYRVGLGV
ncbi:head-tail connector protein [Acidovorax sp.]|uniref:head-tail connector protein n=1 Tax=Acidovorax sp. TaxID=1872122 RepID=UPI002ACD92CB|nr:head-tail connector protein [Acidovorax sp.]MDZ7863379.1 head-tail connector protein [Acidovorax sp.]